MGLKGPSEHSQTSVRWGGGVVGPWHRGGMDLLQTSDMGGYMPCDHGIEMGGTFFRHLIWEGVPCDHGIEMGETFRAERG